MLTEVSLVMVYGYQRSIVHVICNKVIAVYILLQNNF